MYPVNIRVITFKDWKKCTAYWPDSKPVEVGAGMIQLRIEVGWNLELQTDSLVVLEREGCRVLYEKI